MERPRIRIVLTAGAQIKRSPVFENPDERYTDEDGEFIYKFRARIEPDLEGKMRLISALEDIQNGRITKILIAGGAKNFGRPLALIYLDWLNRYVRMGRIPYGSTDAIRGGVNTETDLEKTKKELDKSRFNGQLILYSSGYHFERRSIAKFKKRYPEGTIETVNAEEKVLERRNLFGRIVPKILTVEHLSAMRARNRKMDKLPQFALNLGAYLLRR